MYKKNMGVQMQSKWPFTLNAGLPETLSSLWPYHACECVVDRYWGTALDTEILKVHNTKAGGVRVLVYQDLTSKIVSRGCGPWFINNVNVSTRPNVKDISTMTQVSAMAFFSEFWCYNNCIYSGKIACKLLQCFAVKNDLRPIHISALPTLPSLKIIKYWHSYKFP